MWAYPALQEHSMHLNANWLPYVSFSSHILVSIQALAIQLQVLLHQNNQPLTDDISLNEAFEGLFNIRL